MSLTITDLRAKRQTGDRVFRWATLIGGAAILLILVLIGWTISQKSALIFQTEGLDFFTQKRWAPSADPPVFGALSFIYGTAITATIALILAVPVSIGLALFTTQVAKGAFRRALVTMTDVVAVVPSVVFGLWGIIYFAPKMIGVYKNVHNFFEGWPILGTIFGPASSGRTFMTTGL